MLTDTQRRLREYKTTASSAPVIMNGDGAELLALWRERIGEAEPEDFTDHWPVQLGSHLEPFVLDWHERRTGHVLTERGDVVPHPEHSFVSATLDAYRAFDDTVLDCKVSSAWRPLDDIIGYYTPQIIVQMRCRQCARGALLICHGAAEPKEYDITADPDYEREMWQRLAAFQLCCETFTPPVPLPRVIPPEQWRSIDLNSPVVNWPNWGHALAPVLRTWTDTKDAADEHNQANRDLRLLLPDDVGLVTFKDITIKRARNSAVSVKRSAP
jgi:hypothetical protein